MPTYSDIINKMKKEWKAESLMAGANTERGGKIQFSSPILNWATYGGIPMNGITEFFGEPGGGKTTTAIDICKNAKILFQQQLEDKARELREQIARGNKAKVTELEDLLERGPKKVLYVDLEHSFDQAWSKTLGIEDADWVMQPPNVTAESVLNTISELIQTGEMGLVVLDSIPSLVPETELTKKIGEKTVAALANILTVFIRKVVPLLTRYETSLLFINQTRDNQDNPYEVKTPGGRAVRFYANLRIYFRLGNPVDFLGNELPMREENPAGYKVMAKLAKQKTAPFDRKLATYFLMCSGGIRPDFDYAQLAVNRYGIIKKAGAWFTFTDPYTGEVLEKPDPNNPDKSVIVKVNGMQKVYDYFKQDPDYYNKLSRYIMDDISGKVSEEVIDTTSGTVTDIDLPEDSEYEPEGDFGQ